MKPYSHLIVGLDLSEDSEKVVGKAKSIAACFGAKISLAHVIEPLAFAYGGDIPIDLSDAQAAMEKHAQEKLNAISKQHDVQVTQSLVSVGSTANELHTLAKEYEADLIVVGCHGRHGFALLLGSTANGVLHGTECDVLAVKV